MARNAIARSWRSQAFPTALAIHRAPIPIKPPTPSQGRPPVLLSARLPEHQGSLRKTALRSDSVTSQRRRSVADLRSAIAEILRGGGKRDVSCPAHDDQRRSLSVGPGTDGRVVAHCHAGCATDAVLAAAGLTWADVMPKRAMTRGEIIATYDHCDESGTPVFQSVRYAPKGFRLRRPDGAGAWTWDLKGVRRIPYALERLTDHAPDLWIVEGHKDAESLWRIGLPATTSPQGASDWRDSYTEDLTRVAGVERVNLLPDHDHAGWQYVRRVAASFHARGVTARIVTLPGVHDGGPPAAKHGRDVSDWLADGHSADELRAHAEAAGVWTGDATARDAETPAADDAELLTARGPITPPEIVALRERLVNSGSRNSDARTRAHPIIVTTHMDLAAATAQALTALVTTNDPPQLFLLGDSPVRVEPHPNDGRLITRELTESRVVHHLARSIEWVKISHDGQRRAALPSVPVARNILASPSLPFPPLERIVEVPVFGRDGALCATPGYHAGARLLYQPAPRLEIPPVPASPTDAQITAARRLLCEELTGEFPFTSEAEHAHAIALLLLPFVRDLIDGPTPLYLIEKSTAGTGATLLADVLMRPALGRALPAMTVGKDPDEMRKRLTAVLSESPSAVLFDNARRLDSDDLSAVLTTTVWKDRPLGVSRVVHLPVRCAWIATANNPALTFELTRRTVRIRLDAGVGRPWLRDSFRHPDLVAWTTKHRAELIAAALTLAQAWIARGWPRGTHAQLGSYESWSRVLGGILETARIPGFLGNLTAFYEDVVDDETQTWRALIAAWWTRHGSATVGVQEIWALTQGEPRVDVDLGDKGEPSQRVRLGKLLARMRDRIFDGYRVTSAKSVRNAQQWRLCSIAVPAGAPATGVRVEKVVRVSTPIHKTPILPRREGKHSPPSPPSHERPSDSPDTPAQKSGVACDGRVPSRHTDARLRAASGVDEDEELLLI